MRSASPSPELDASASSALQTLYDSVPEAKKLGKSAVAVLVFPNVVKGGLVFGGHYGEGALFKKGRAFGHYNSIAASWGTQAGLQRFGYALFFMDEKALTYLDTSDGWEVGVGQSIVMAGQSISGALTTTEMRRGVYGFVFAQQGLMAGLGLEGSKITRIDP